MMKVYAVPKDDSKKEKAKCWIKNRFQDIRCFWEENKAYAPVVVGGIVVLAKVITRQQKIYQEKRLKDLYMYDPSLRKYWVTKRKLTAAESLELERRRQNGEGMGNILASMKVLKL